MTGLAAVVVWLIIGIIFFIFESMTYQLVSIWFVVGSAGAILASILNANLTLQLITFLVVSVVFLFVARPIVKEKVNSKKIATNADRVIGMTGVVLELIDNLAATGRVRANGLDWSARTTSDNIILEKDTKVKVIAIDGVKLLVEPMQEEEA